jgi:hypothetical protein
LNWFRDFQYFKIDNDAADDTLKNVPGAHHGPAAGEMMFEGNPSLRSLNLQTQHVLDCGIGHRAIRGSTGPRTGLENVGTMRFFACMPMSYCRTYCRQSSAAGKNVKARTIGSLLGSDMDEEERIPRFCHAYAMAQRVLDMATERSIRASKFSNYLI